MGYSTLQNERKILFDFVFGKILIGSLWKIELGSDKNAAGEFSYLYTKYMKLLNAADYTQLINKYQTLFFDNIVSHRSSASWGYHRNFSSVNVSNKSKTTHSCAHSDAINKYFKYVFQASFFVDGMNLFEYI